MRMARRMTVGACGVLIALFATGCTSPDQIQIETLQKKVQDLDAENASLRERLAKAIADRDAALAQARALRQQLDALNQQSVERGPKGWEFYGPYAWTTLGTDFLFASGQATLRSEARAKLAQVVSEIQSNFPEKAVWVLGHTDTDPIKYTKDKWKDNLDLSSNRAMTVYRELMKMGIAPERMIAGGQGEWFRRANNDTKAGKQENRRVEIIVVPPRAAVGSPAPSQAETPKTGPESGSAALVPVPKE
jgi:chemotaxis protein MotB